MYQQLIEEYHQEAIKGEEMVALLLSKVIGGTTAKSTLSEDMNLHIDFWWAKPNEEKVGVDVKGVKKNNRKDKTPDDTINWLELKNINGGKGWLYGEAEYIAFITLSDVVFVKRDPLAKYAEKCVDGKELVRFCPKECYIPYQRFGRKDLIIKVPTTDLRELSWKHGFILNLEHDE